MIDLAAKLRYGCFEFVFFGDGVGFGFEVVAFFEFGEDFGYFFEVVGIVGSFEFNKDNMGKIPSGLISAESVCLIERD